MARTGKNRAKDILSNVPEDKVFWANDGRVLRNLKDLPAALVDMSNEAFKYHVNEDKNDFKNWILDVVRDEKLAKSIAKTKSKEVLLRKLDKRIYQLESLNARRN